MIKIRRPILIVAIGFLIGIIYGLYFKISIAFAFIIIYIFYLLFKLNIRFTRIKILRYLKVLLKLKIVIIICLSAIISNTYLICLNYKYNKIYENLPNTIKGEAVIIGDKIEKEYNYTYTIKMKSGNYKNKRFILSIKKDENKLEYGDLIEIEGEYILPTEKRNYKGFNYREYLKTKKIFGIIKVNNNKIEIIEKSKINKALIITNELRNSIIEKIEMILPDKTNKLLEGILLGNKSKIQEDILENFKTSNLSHILSVSGAHTSYIILGVSYILIKSKISRKYVYIITIIVLLIFMFITNFTVSVIRACLMGILMMGAKIFHRKVDFASSISIALLITLLYNPFSINEIGLQLSYLGTIGIILFNKNIEKLFRKIKINKKISKLLSVAFSAQLMIMPIMALKFNTISLTFFISNILVSPILGIIMLLGFITVFTSFISYTMAKMLSIVLNLILEMLICISNFCSKLPFSKILIKTPYITSIIFVYLLILISNYIITNYSYKEILRLFQRSFLKITNIKKPDKLLRIFCVVTIILILFCFINALIQINLEIYFIDVGQGDSTLIITPNNKKILIDGGKGDTSVLLDYLLDRRIKNIDYVIISHFDSDHCNGLIDVIKNLNVKNIIISKQAYISDEYINIAKIINKKRINVIQVKQGDILKIDKHIKIDIIYPPKELEYEDLNNNSIVLKIAYNNFSILFTRRYRGF